MSDINSTNSIPQDDQTAVQPQAPVQPVVPVAPIGSANKEAGPVGSPISEFVKPTETEPEITKELKDLGVEAKKDEPNVTDEHKAFIDHAKQFASVQAPASSKVTLPMSEDEIADKLKTGQDDDSGKWLAGIVQKVIRAFGL